MASKTQKIPIILFFIGNLILLFISFNFFSTTPKGTQNLIINFFSILFPFFNIVSTKTVIIVLIGFFQFIMIIIIEFLEKIKKQFEILERIGIEGRAEMTFQLSDNLRQITESGIRLRHPEYNDREVWQEVVRITLGDELYRKIVEEREKDK